MLLVDLIEKNTFKMKYKDSSNANIYHIYGDIIPPKPNPNIDKTKAKGIKCLILIDPGQ